MKVRIASALFIFILSVGNVFAGGLNCDYIGLRATGMGNIYTGVADDSSAVFWNPAGLVQIPEGKIDYGVELFTGTIPDYTYNAAVDGKDYSTTEPFGAPGLFAATRKGNLAFGAGFYAAYGSGAVSIEDVPMYGDLTSTLGLFALGLSISYEVSPKLSIGFTGETAIGMMNHEMSRAYQELGQGMYNYVNFEQEMWATNTGYRGIFGVMYKPFSDVRIGVVAKSPTTLEFEGDVKITVVDSGNGTLPTGFKIADDGSATYTTETPWYFITGVSYKITQKMLITGEYAYRWWSDVEFKETEFKSVQGPIKSVSPTNWIDNWTLGFGIKYELTPKWVVTGGVVYQSHAVDSKDKTVASGGGDLSFYNFAGGAGYKISKSIELICNFYYYKAIEEIDISGNTYKKKMFGNILGIKGVF